MSWEQTDPQPQLPVNFFAIVIGDLTSRIVIALVVRPDVFPHLVMPVGPFVADFRAPVVQMMRDAAVSENLGHSVGRPAVFPRTAAGHEPDIATCVMMEIPGITQI